MNYSERIRNDLTQAMKAREQGKVDALRMIKAAFMEYEKSGQGVLTDEKAAGILRRLRKQRLESSEQYRIGNRLELAEAEEAEILIIDSYLPQTASSEQTRIWLQEVIQQTGATSAKESGKVTGAFMKLHKAEADATLVRDILKELLQ